jgi:hypothetical protein
VNAAAAKYASLLSLSLAFTVHAEMPINPLPGVVDAVPVSTATLPIVQPALPVPSAHAKTYELLQALNQLPQNQLTEKSGPIFSILESLRTEDGPEYMKLRVLLARADIRKTLNPGAKGIFAGLIFQRWDAFNLAGNLWLGALQSTNTEVQSRARQQVVNFIQPAHIPVLINLLKIPGPNVLAYEILQDVTGHNVEPNPKLWEALWNKGTNQIDVVGRVLSQSRLQLQQLHIRPFDQTSLWYLPEELSRANLPYEKRSVSEKNVIGHWADTLKPEVARYLDQWETARPLFDRIVHQPDPRVGEYLRSLVSDHGFGDYVSIILAWRGDLAAQKLIQEAYSKEPSVGRALALAQMGDKNALQDLLKMIEAKKMPLSFGIMDDVMKGYAARLPALGQVPAEQAFEMLTNQDFGLATAPTAREKRKNYNKALRWLADHSMTLKLDKKRGYYVSQ